MWSEYRKCQIVNITHVGITIVIALLHPLTLLTYNVRTYTALLVCILILHTYVCIHMCRLKMGSQYAARSCVASFYEHVAYVQGT